MCIETQIREPLVSVIMPAYNAELFIEEAISSVFSQTVEDWELIVIDDCSIDGTYEVALKYGDPRICVMRNDTNCGVAKTRNRGIGLAKGKYIAFLDSDDVWYPEKLYYQIEKLIKENAQICYCSYAIIGESGDKVKADYLVPKNVGFEDLLKENCIQCSAMLIRADIVKQVLFNTKFYHEDYILGLDMLGKGYRAVGCSNVLLAWRYAKNSRSFNKWRAAKNRWIIYRRHLKLPVNKSIWLFLCYTAAGVRKYI